MNHSEISSAIWSTTDDVLRGAFKPSEYGRIILPLTVLRRLDSIVEGQKDEIVKFCEDNKDRINPSIIRTKFGIPFYNKSKFDLSRLMQDPTNIFTNFQNYMDGFSDNIADILKNFKFPEIVKRLEIPLDFYDSWVEINEKIQRKTELMIEKFIPNATSLRWNSEDQDITNARYFERRRPDDGKFTWSSQCVDIYNLVRAVKKPHPGAFFIDNSNNKKYLKNYLHPLKVMDLKIKNLENSIKIPFQLKSKFTSNKTLLLRLSQKETKEKIDFELKNMNWDKKNIDVRLKKLLNAKELDILPEMILYICELLNKEYEIVSFKFSKKIKDHTKDYFSKSNKIRWSDKKNSLEIS